MTSNIQYVQMPVSESMNTMVEHKLEKLHKKYDYIINADVFFKQENNPKGKGKICEIRLSLPGPRLFAKSDSDNFEKSLSETIHDLEGQLRKRKTILNKHK